jgi:hypothetical protein
MQFLLTAKHLGQKINKDPYLARRGASVSFWMSSGSIHALPEKEELAI